jgi:16S rRNA (cytidine1402-2'-O)-methyltransferase
MGILYLVATPIGNLEDITLRAIRILTNVALIAAEDTRHTRKLLTAYKIRNKVIVSYREQNHAQVAPHLLTRLRTDDDVALVSDAGTPGISDPGQALVRTAIEQGIRVVPVPGACAAISALSASGLMTDRFIFYGFFPRKPGALRKWAEELSNERASLIIYESPKRLSKTLSILASVFGPRDAVVVREMTKIHENFDRSDLATLAQRYSTPTKGEVVVVVAGASTQHKIQINKVYPVVNALLAGKKLSARQITQVLAPLCEGRRREVYQMTIARGQ